MACAQILLVEDDVEISTMLTAVLSEGGFAVRSARSANEVAEVLQKQPVDLIVLDIMLPDEDGLSIGRRLGNR